MPGENLNNEAREAEGDSLLNKTEATEVESSSAILPSGRKLLKDGFEFAKTHLNLTVALAIPFLLTALIAFYAQNVESANAPIIAGVLSVLLGIVYAFVYAACLYVVINEENSSISLTRGLTWTKENFFGLALVYILTTLIVSGGMILFVIPGIILSLLLYLGLYVYVAEGKKGMAALLRSRNLVKGNTWLLLKRLVVVGLLVLLAVFGVGLILGLIAEILFSGAGTQLFHDLAMQVISAFVTVVFISIGYTIYKNFKLYRDSYPLEEPLTKTWHYKVLMVIGLIIFAATTWAIFNLPDMENYQPGQMYCGETALDKMLLNHPDCDSATSEADSAEAKQRAVELGSEN